MYQYGYFFFPNKAYKPAKIREIVRMMTRTSETLSQIATNYELIIDCCKDISPQAEKIIWQWRQLLATTRAVIT